MESPEIRIIGEIIILAAFVVMYWSRWKQGVKQRLWALPIVVWLLVSLVHYAFWLIYYYQGNPENVLGSEWMLTWGGIARILGFATILILEIYRLLKGRYIINGH
jgi:hypothetical protein